MSVLQAAQVYDNGLLLKFNKILKVSTITNAAFTLYANLATPVTTPFEQIVLSRDYNSIARTVSLYFKPTLTAGVQYRLTISGLKDAAGVTLADTNYDFYPRVNPQVEALQSIEVAPVEIIDKSEQSTAFMVSETITRPNPDFYIVKTLPDNHEIYLDEGYNSGRVAIQFSTKPTPAVLNKDFFKVQRKKIQRSPSKWENITVRISLDQNKPWVYLDFPSTDATPVYVTPGKDYFESGYKYRITVSKDVGI